MLLGLLALAGAPVELAEAEAAVGDRIVGSASVALSGDLRSADTPGVGDREHRALRQQVAVHRPSRRILRLQCEQS